MRNRLLLAVAIVLLFAGSHLAKGLLDGPRQVETPEVRPYERIVSMAPSITETLFALGLGDRVVGVTRYCTYPAEAQDKAIVGGYHNPNLEAVVALQPDLVVLLSGHEHSQPAFRKLGLPTLTLRHTSLEGILDSILIVGRTCDREDQARQLVADIESRMDRVRAKTADLVHPRVMVAVGRAGVGTGRLEDVYIAGRDGHLDRIVAAAGGQNACTSGTVRFPVVSSEGILKINPEVIVDLVRVSIGPPQDTEAVRADWQQVAQVDAVKNDRVFVIDDDFATIPGPRFVLLVEKLARLIHPEVDWEEGMPK
ncbi:MAG TPA: helical backbone metal receptor [Thermoguttaceae bacterium]|nr:helical backbone metal receptor [Thermoguttaceae bacterium]